MLYHNSMTTKEKPGKKPGNSDKVEPLRNVSAGDRICSALTLTSTPDKSRIGCLVWMQGKSDHAPVCLSYALWKCVHDHL